MTDDKLELSRRKILASASAVGLAGAGAGLGTSAYFSDQETFTNNQLVAGELDLKVAVSQHYVDWLPDTNTANGNVSPNSPQETDDAEMPDSSGDADLVLEAGMGGTDTVAQDIELDITDVVGLADGSLVNEIHGGVPIGPYGTDDTETYPEDSLCNLSAGGDDDVDRAIVQLEDVKPGDFGFIRFAAAACDNPAFAWLTADIEDANENGTTEPEREDPDEQAGVVELLDVVQTAVIDGDVANLLSADPSDDATTVSPEQTLRGLANTRAPVSGDINAPEGGGAEGARDCFSALTNHRATLVWWVPIDHGNEIQTDSVTFSLGMEVEQCRHNDGSGIGEFEAELADGTVIPFSCIESDQSIEDYYGYSSSEVNGPAGDLARSDESIVFAYCNTETGDLHLVFIHDDGDSEDSTDGEADFEFSGTADASDTENSDWTVEDDDSGNTGEAPHQWTWDAGKTDGGALAVDQGFEVTVDPDPDQVNDTESSLDGLEEWVLLGSDGNVVAELESDLSSGDPSPVTFRDP